MQTLSVLYFQKMFKEALASITAREQEFSQLDAVIGDGDHGTAIVQAMKSIVSALEKGTEFKTMLNEAGFNVMLETSGSTSTLLGGWILGMSDNSQGTELDAAGIKKMFQGGLEGVQKNTKAMPGDKTMMDALYPAVQAMQQEDTSDIERLFEVAAAAAQKGAKATIQMKANFGRARNYGERSIGYADSGATSWACMFESFYQAIHI